MQPEQAENGLSCARTGGKGSLSKCSFTRFNCSRGLLLHVTYWLSSMHIPMPCHSIYQQAVGRLQEQGSGVVTDVLMHDTA